MSSIKVLGHSESNTLVRARERCEKRKLMRYHALKWDTQQLTSEVSKKEVGLKIMISLSASALLFLFAKGK